MTEAALIMHLTGGWLTVSEDCCVVTVVQSMVAACRQTCRWSSS